MHRILSCVGIALCFFMGLSSDAKARHRHQQQRTGMASECNVIMPSCEIMPNKSYQTPRMSGAISHAQTGRTVRAGGESPPFFFGAPQQQTYQRPTKATVRVRMTRRTILVRHVTRSHEEAVRRVSVYGGDHTQIVDHPSGCPRTAFCGCGAAVRLFGKPIASLMAAASWFRFPRADPAPGMAAVRQHHVMVIEGKLDNGMWLVYDANSGGHRTRIHARSLAGYRIVNPQGGRG
jgi:hypothetical protein